MKDTAEFIVAESIYRGDMRCAQVTVINGRTARCICKTGHETYAKTYGVELPCEFAYTVGDLITALQLVDPMARVQCVADHGHDGGNWDGTVVPSPSGTSVDLIYNQH